MATALRELHAAMEAADAGKAENRLAEVAAERDAAQEPRAYRAALEEGGAGGREGAAMRFRCESDPIPIQLRFRFRVDCDRSRFESDSDSSAIRFDPLRC